MKTRFTRAAAAALLALVCAMPAVAGDVHVPQFAAGGGYRTEILVSNTTTVEYFGELAIAGRGADLLLDETVAFEKNRIRVPALGTRRFVLSSASAAVGSGSLTVSPAEGIAVSTVYEGPGGDVGVPSATPAFHFWIPVTIEAGKVYTGVAWVAVGSHRDHFTRLTLYDEDGSIVDDRTRRYRGHEARWVDELLGVPHTFRRGLLEIETPYAYALIALRARAVGQDLVYTSIPTK